MRDPRSSGDHRSAVSQRGSPASHGGTTAIRVLLVEDVPTEAEVTSRQLRRGGLTCEVLRVDTEEDFTAALPEFRPQVILSDFTLPRFSGLAALKLARKLADEIPFIFVSGTIGEEQAVEALRSGAVDYVLKSNLTRLVPAVTRAMEEAAARTERRRQELQIARLTRVLRMLSGVNGVMLRVRQRDHMLEEACRLAVSVGGYAAAMVILDQPGARTTQVAGTGSDSKTAEQLRAIIAESNDQESFVIGKVLKTGKAFICNDTAELAGTAKPGAAMVQAGFRSVVGLPIVLGKMPTGVLVLAAADAGVLSDEELAMLREVAANLSFALQYLQNDSRVRFLSDFDPHTGLAKRSLFCERVARSLAGRRPGEAPRAIAVIDIEQLSVINDSFGRHAGDLLLQHVADRLRRHFRDTQLLAQLGGGTFAVAIDVAGNAGDALKALRGHVTAVFGEPFEIDERKVPIAVKSGLAAYPDNGDAAEALVQNAEAALRDARLKGERHLHYSAEANSEAMARLALEHKLRTAIEKEQFELHYQPKVNVKTRSIEGVEALIRWRDPEAGLVPPATFLPLLEATGLIMEVGDWVLRQASLDCQRWRRDGLAGVRVAVNISPVQLCHSDFLGRFVELTQSWADPTCGLDVEIIEGMLLGDSTAAVRRLERLRAAGVRVAVDDFGTGYSSLSRLSELPIDTLKVDRSFISRLPNDRAARTLVSTIISLARAFNMTVVAEGVETEEQLGALWNMGCDEAQGYLLSRPVAGDELAQLLAHGKGRIMLPASRAKGRGDVRATGHRRQI